MNILQNHHHSHDTHTPNKDSLSSTALQEDHHLSTHLSLEDSPAVRSLEALGSSLYSQRKLSAFSIYNPSSSSEDSAHPVSI